MTGHPLRRLLLALALAACKPQQQPAAPAAAPPVAPAPAAGTDFREVVTQAMLALARDLPARHVQVLELYFCREWPARRVGEALRMPAATVFTIAHRHKIRFMREILCRL